VIIQSLPLLNRQTSPNAYVTDIEITVDGIKKRFLLDTGAADSTIALDIHTRNYPSLGKAESKGVSDKAIICDLIQPEKIGIGLHEIKSPLIKRCDKNILGIDLIGTTLFQVNICARRFNLLKEMPKTSLRPIRRLSPGHLTIPLLIGEKKIDVLFDTGADTTVIDLQFVKSHPENFKLVRSEEGTDAHGHKIESDIYECLDLIVGHLRLKDVEMAAFNFGDLFRFKMEGSPMIFGNNVISKGIWSFDMRRLVWTVE